MASYSLPAFVSFNNYQCLLIFRIPAYIKFVYQHFYWHRFQWEHFVQFSTYFQVSDNTDFQIFDLEVVDLPMTLTMALGVSGTTLSGISRDITSSYISPNVHSNKSEFNVHSNKNNIVS